MYKMQKKKRKYFCFFYVLSPWLHHWHETGCHFRILYIERRRTTRTVTTPSLCLWMAHLDAYPFASAAAVSTDTAVGGSL